MAGTYGFRIPLSRRCSAKVTSNGYVGAPPDKRQLAPPQTANAVPHNDFSSGPQDTKRSRWTAARVRKLSSLVKYPNDILW